MSYADMEPGERRPVEEMPFEQRDREKMEAELKQLKERVDGIEGEDRPTVAYSDTLAAHLQELIVRVDQLEERVTRIEKREPA